MKLDYNKTKLEYQDQGVIINIIVLVKRDVSLKYKV